MIGKAVFGLGLALPLLLAGCQGGRVQQLATVQDLDLQRFMGDWYVIANIPTFLEKGAHNAVESYALKADGEVATTFSFRDGGFDGPQKIYTPTGFVDPDDSAVWGMQFIWPIKAEFLVLFVDPDYQRTIIGRSARDYVWLMAREPEITAEAYEELIAVTAAAGYDISRIERVPQRWDNGR